MSETEVVLPAPVRHAGVPFDHVLRRSSGHGRSGHPEIASTRRHDPPKCGTIPGTGDCAAIFRRRFVLTTGLLETSCEDERDDALQRLLSNLLKLATSEIETQDTTCVNPAFTTHSLCSRSAISKLHHANTNGSADGNKVASLLQSTGLLVN